MMTTRGPLVLSAGSGFGFGSGVTAGLSLFAEVAPGDDRDAQRLEEARAHGVEIDVRLFVGLPLVALYGDIADSSANWRAE